MQAGRTQLWSLGRFVQVAAIYAAPSGCSIARKNAPFFEISRQILVTLAMLFFCDGDTFESNSNLSKALFAGDFGKFRVEFGPLVLFASGGRSFRKVR